MDMTTYSSDEFSCDEQPATPESPKGNQSTTTISSSTSRRKFTEEEDKLLSKLVSEMGPRKWDQIAKKMPNNRTARQCRDRYSNYLIPGFFNGEWSKEEDELLYKKYQEYGPKWAVIKEYFTNRSPNAIKNRWNYFVSRSSSIASSVNAEKNKNCEDSMKQNFVSSSQIISPPTVINASAPIFSLWTTGRNFIPTQQLSPVQAEMFATGYSTIYSGVSCGFFTPNPSNSIQLTIPQNYQMIQNSGFGNNFNRCNFNYINTNFNTKTAVSKKESTKIEQQNSSVSSSPAQSDFEDENDTWEIEETNLFDCIENDALSNDDDIKLSNLCYFDTPENEIFSFY